MIYTDKFKTNFGSFIPHLSIAIGTRDSAVIQMNKNPFSYGNYILFGRKIINKMNKQNI